MKRRNQLFTIFGLIALVAIFVIAINLNGGGTPLNADTLNRDIVDASMNPVIGSNSSGTVSGSNFSGTANVSFTLQGPSNLTITNISFQWRWYSNTSNNFTVANGTRQDLVANRTIFNDSIASLNSIAENDTLWNYTFVTTTLPDGVYNVTILVYNFSGGIAELPFANQSFMTYVTVDNKVAEVNITKPQKWPSQVAVEVSADDVHNLSFNVTVRDVLSGVKNVTFQFSNGSSTLFNGTATNRSHFLPNATYGDVYGSLFVTWEVLVNASSLSDENPMTVTIYATDFAGNLNKTETFTINVDKTAPTLTMTLKEGTETSLEITVATSSDARTCTTTLGTITGTGSTRTITATDLSPATSYSFTVRCSDEVDNSKSLTSSFTTESPSGSAAGVDGSAARRAAAKKVTAPTAAVPGQAAVVMDFVVNRATSVSVGEVSHTVTVVSATAQRVTVTISSEPVTITLDAGESKEIDTDGDGKNDLRVRYVALVSGKPKLELTSLATAAAAASVREQPAAAEPVAETTPAPAVEESSRSLSWVIILVVIVAAAAAYFGLRKKE